ncbi:MAG: hypothetical protein E1N59_1243 [Puniceicoccaceae bacterium 5H]|nr:MAG: hypothetical protein E1N59_1243 [Puniceicoccaceae bacterium 5H]
MSLLLKRLPTLLLVLLLLLVGGIILGVFWVWRAPTEEPALRVGYNHWAGYEFLSLAEEFGLYEQEGVVVQLVELGSLGDVRRAFERGQVDVMASTLIESVLAQELTRDQVSIIYAADYSAGSDMIVARQDVEGVAGLKGKRIGVEPAALDLLVVMIALGQAGLSLDDVTVVPLSQGELVEGFRQGRIDAAATYPVVSHVLLARPELHRLWDSTAAPGSIVDVFSVKEEMLRSRRDQLVHFLRAYDGALRLHRENPTVTVERMARRQNVTPKQFERALEGIELLEFGQQAELLQAGGVVERSSEQTLEALRALSFYPDNAVGRPAVDPSLVEEASRP